MRELSKEEVGQVNGGMFLDAMPGFTAAIGLAAARYGKNWALVPIRAAFVASPIVFGAVVGITLAAGVVMARD